MTEIFIKKEQEGKKIALVENGILTEYYEENTEDNRITLITCVENMYEYRRCVQAVEII